MYIIWDIITELFIDDKNQNEVKFSLTDFHFLNNVLHINRNLKFILHSSQYSDKFTINNDTLDLNKDKIQINPKSIVKVDATGAPQGTIMGDSDDKLQVTYSSDFFTKYNSSLYLNIGPGLTRDADSKISSGLAQCNLKFVNNQICLDMNAMVNDFNCIKVDDKKRLRLDYSPDDVMKDSTGKLYLKLENKHIVRTIHGLQLNIDNDTISYDSNSNKLISSINKYLGLFGQINTGDIYLDSNKKMRLNINNYIDDNVGSKVIMNTNNKIDFDILDQTAGSMYFDTNNTLTLRLGSYFSKDSSGHGFPHSHENGLNFNNYKINLKCGYLIHKHTVNY